MTEQNKNVAPVGARLLDILKEYVPDTTPVPIALSQLVPGSHRDISGSGLHKLRESYIRNGALESHMFIVQELEEGKYEIIEGNHRFTVWKEHNITTWPCIVIPKDKPLSVLQYNQIAGAYNDLNSYYVVPASDYTKLTLIWRLVQSSSRYWLPHSTSNTISNSPLQEDIALANQDFTISRVEQFTRVLQSLVDFTDSRNTSASKLMDIIKKHYTKKDSSSFTVRKIDCKAFRECTSSTKKWIIHFILNDVITNTKQIEDFAKHWNDLLLPFFTLLKNLGSSKLEIVELTGPIFRSKSYSTSFTVIEDILALNKVNETIELTAIQSIIAKLDKNSSKKGGRPKNIIQECNVELNENTLKAIIQSLYITTEDSLSDYKAHLVVCLDSQTLQIIGSIEYAPNVTIVVVETSITSLFKAHEELLSKEFTHIHTFYVTHSKPINEIQTIAIHLYSQNNSSRHCIKNLPKNSLLLPPITPNELPLCNKPTSRKRKVTSPKSSKMIQAIEHNCAEYNFSIHFWQNLLSQTLASTKVKYFTVISYIPMYGSLLVASILHQKAIPLLCEDDLSFFEQFSSEPYLMELIQRNVSLSNFNAWYNGAWNQFKVDTCGIGSNEPDNSFSESVAQKQSTTTNTSTAAKANTLQGSIAKPAKQASQPRH